MRYFSVVLTDLETALAKLKVTNDPNLRRLLLHEMRVLLLEATHVANSP
jgi:hypothetical protein